MASSASRGGDRAVHQDYIARIRYSNTLPPPPNPPKLLDIPNTGLASGQYTNPGFASRLAREQPLNIEADAELGMPIDLVGMPGIFDGDESSIQAPLYPPAPHPNDRALLRPLASLGKPKTSESGVSFLRRTEYISSHTGGKARFDASNSKTLRDTSANRVKKLPTDVDKESPEYIKAKIERSFEIARMKMRNPAQIRHPNKQKSNAKLVSALPILPDLHAFSDFGGYLTIKFAHNPVPPSSKYDPRLEASLFRPVEQSEEAAAAFDAATQLHEQDPTRYPAPPAQQNFEFFMLDDSSSALNYKRKIDELDPDHDSEALYTYKNDTSQNVFRFSRIREYEMASTVDQLETKYDDELALASNDGRDPKRQKAMYYYPIIQRQVIRPQRKRNMDQRRYGSLQEQEEEMGVDMLDIQIRDPHDGEIKAREAFAENPLRGAGEDEDDEEGGADLDADADGEGDVDTREERDEVSKDASANGRNGSEKRAVSVSDEDASGSDE